MFEKEKAAHPSLERALSVAGPRGIRDRHPHERIGQVK